MITKESFAGGGLVATTIVSAFATIAPEAEAQAVFDWQLEVVGQAGAVQSQFDLAPLSFGPVPQKDAEPAVGRVIGRLDLGWTYEFEGFEFGVRGGLYSMTNTAYDEPSGVYEIDRANPGLTRVRENTALDLDKLFAFYENDVLGRVELGWSRGPNAQMAVAAPSDYGVGGTGGDFPYFFDKPQDVSYLSVSTLGSENRSPRVSYYSPKFWGSTVAVSFQPDTRNQGLDFESGDMAFGYNGRRVLAVNAPLDAGSDIITPTSSFEAYTAGFQNVFEASVRTEFDLGAVQVRGSAGWTQGDAIPSPSGTQFNDLSSYQAGIQVDYGAWTFGAGISRASNSGYPELAHWRQRAEAYSMTFGVQYEMDKFVFGGGILYGDDAGDASERSDRQLRAGFIGMTYKYSDNVDFGIELDQIGTLSADYGDYTNHALLAQVRYRI